MNPVASTKIIKIKSFEKFDFDDTLVREVRLNIFLNEKKVISLMATPTDEKALAIGYLISENLINSLNEILDIKIDKDSEF
ncbi:formate dehydrogenase accessory sulfurtransferase FdhD, partial [Klebsiella pneumoniae]|nr:formate dehydrogenase accessory sulfurtransferase FdhD [Klebsiella pneumoniae]